MQFYFWVRSCNSTSGFDLATDVARNSNYVILVAGLSLTEETEDLDRVSLLLPGKQMQLVNTISSVTKRPIVLVLIGGGPIDVSFAKEHKDIGGIIWIGYPGEVGGQVLAEVLFGDYNPDGRLPITWYPESFTNVPMSDMNMRPDPSRSYPGRTYRFYTGETVYKFGYGLSYSNFSYKFLSAPDKLILSLPYIEMFHMGKIPDYVRTDGPDHVYIKNISSCQDLKFSVRVSVFNHGGMNGAHTVLLFVRHRSNLTDYPVKQLIGFERVHTSVGETTEVEIFVDNLIFSTTEKHMLIKLATTWLPHMLIKAVEKLTSLPLVSRPHEPTTWLPQLQETSIDKCAIQIGKQ